MVQLYTIWITPIYRFWCLCFLVDHKIGRISLWYFSHKLESFLRFQKQIWDCETALQKNWDQETKKPKIFDKHFSPYLSFLFPPPFPLSPPPPPEAHVCNYWLLRLSHTSIKEIWRNSSSTTAERGHKIPVWDSRKVNVFCFSNKWHHNYFL